MKRILIVSAVVGFAVPVFWGVLAFVDFNGPEGRLSDLFWDAVYITCPPWLIPEESPLGNWFVTPFLNAALYASIALVAYGLFMLIKGKRQQTPPRS
jgi:hypothetical protein